MQMSDLLIITDSSGTCNQLKKSASTIVTLQSLF